MVEQTDEIEETTFDPTEDLKKGLEEIKKSLPKYEKAERYFLGTEEEKFVSKELRKLLSGSETDFNVNLAGRVVSAVTDRLEIAAITASPAGVASHAATMDSIRQVSNETFSSGSGDVDNLTWVLNEKVWHRNELDIEAPEVHEKATYFGDSYLFVWPSEEDDEDELDIEVEGESDEGVGFGNVDIFFNSPKGCRMLYDTENPRKRRVYVKTWETDSGYKRVNLYYPHHIVKFISKTKKSRGDKVSDYRPMQPREDEDVNEFGVAENPFGEIPAFHFRTARPYGRPEHEGAFGPQDAITKLVKSKMTISDFAAYPQRWALGETGIGTDDDFDWDDERDSTNPEDLASNFTSGPGRVWVLKGVHSVGQFQPAHPSQILEPLDKFIELMASATGTPLTYLHKVRGTSSTPLSGESQKQTEVMLTKKISARQRSYAATWRQALKFALRILGHENVVVMVQWAATMQTNDKQTWDGVLAQQAAGVTKRQTLLEQGYPVAQVESWGYTEEEPNGPPEEIAEDAFQDEQRKPVRPELRANNDGDISRFNKNPSAKEASQQASQTK